MSRDVTIVLKVDNQFSAPLQQFATEVGDIKTTTTELTGATAQTGDAFSSLAASVTTGLVAFAGWKGLSMVGDMIALGQKVDVTTQGFSMLTENVGGAVSVLQQLREATQFATTDTDLMNESNKLLSLNLVNNSADLAHLIGVADDLAGVFGIDGKAGVDAFTKALETGRANTLVKFGIDLDAVKKRTEELKATMDDKAAFRMAVLEQADATLARFGDAANAAQTPVDRLKTSVQNLADAFQRDFSIGVSSGIGVLEILTGNFPGQKEQAQKSADDAHANAIAYGEAYNAGLTAFFAGKDFGIDPATQTQLLEEAFKRARANPDMSRGQIGQDVIKDMLPELQTNPEYTRDISLATASILQQRDLAEQTYKAQQDQIELQKQQAALQAEAIIQAQRLKVIQQASDEDKQASIQAQRDALVVGQQRRDAMIEYGNAIANVGDQLLSISGDSDPMSAMYTSKLSSDQIGDMMPKYMNAEAADAITSQFKDAEDELFRLHRLADQKLISDDQLTQAENLTSNLGLMADQAQKAADAFKNLTLSQAFGQSSGGMQGEMTDMVLQQMKDKGYGKNAIDAMKQELDMSSGRETSSSEEMKKQIVPLIAKMSAKQASLALANLDAFLKEATLQGMSEEQIAAMMPDVVGFDAQGHTRDINQNEIDAQRKRWEKDHKQEKKKNKDGTYSYTGRWLDDMGNADTFSADPNQKVNYTTFSGGFDFSGQMANFISSQIAPTSSGSKMFGDVSGMDEGLFGAKGGKQTGKGEMATSIMAKDMASINKDGAPAAKSMTTINEQTTLAQKAMKTFHDILEKVPDHKTLTFSFVADDPQGLVGLVKALTGGSLTLATVVKDNGGSVPGSNHAGDGGY